MDKLVLSIPAHGVLKYTTQGDQTKNARKAVFCELVPLAGIEPASPPSEGGILSIERQGVGTV